MSAINLPFGASSDRRAPTTPELASGFQCGPADIELFNWLMRWATGQIAGAIDKSDVIVDDDDLDRLAVALRSQRLNYVAAGGTANALTASLDPVPATHAETIGMPLRLLIAASNTGAATLNAGPGALPVVTMRGAALARDDLPAGGIVTVIGTGTAWVLASLAYSEVPILGNATIWVRTDGNDANDGRANSSSRALATIAEAVSRLQRYASSGNITIRLGNTGTYAAPGIISLGYRDVAILGDTAAQASYVISGSLARLLSATNGGLQVRGVTINNAGGAGIGVSSATGASVSIENVSFTGSAFGSTVILSEGGPLTILGGCIISTGGLAALGASNGSALIQQNNLTVSSTPAFSLGFATAQTAGQIRRGDSNPTISGSATGPRYSVGALSLVNTNGGGANFYPGNAVGVVSASYGVYA